MRGQCRRRLRGGMLTFVDGGFVVKGLLFDSGGGLIFLDFKLLGSVQLLRILLAVLSCNNGGRLLLVEVRFRPLMSLGGGGQLVIALWLLLFAEALLDKVVI